MRIQSKAEHVKVTKEENKYKGRSAATKILKKLEQSRYGSESTRKHQRQATMLLWKSRVSTNIKCSNALSLIPHEKHHLQLSKVAL